MKNNLKYSHFNPVPFEAHMVVFGKIKKGSKVLDVGCATGYFAEKLEEKDCQVWGIEADAKAAKIAEKYCQRVVIADAEKLARLPFQKNFFDYILLLDILEHLKGPENLLRLLIPYLKVPDGQIIISVPNIAHISVRMKLLSGKLGYEKMGIMDENHLRLFTKKILLELIGRVQLNLVSLDYSADFGQLPYIGRFARRIPKSWQHAITKLSNTLLAVQFIAVCQKQK